MINCRLDKLEKTSNIEQIIEYSLEWVKKSFTVSALVLSILILLALPSPHFIVFGAKLKQNADELIKMHVSIGLII